METVACSRSQLLVLTKHLDRCDLCLRKICGFNINSGVKSANVWLKVIRITNQEIPAVNKCPKLFHAFEVR